ncbi:MAG TPA: hypothetical protein VM513_32480 [Kofleriaceae bacterium]|jgi:hypothetical protein|nr:hypothetical protein [Kofleriaceae bacterium]
MTKLSMLVTAVLAACGGGGNGDDEVGTDAGTTDAPTVTNPGVTVVDLGPVQSGVAVPLEIPAHALGFHVILDVDNAVGNESVGVQTVTSPSGAVIVQDFAFVGGFELGPLPTGATAISIPQSSAPAGMPVEPGTWQLTFWFEAGHTARARAMIRTTEDGEFHGGVLDVRIYIPDGLVIDEPMPAHAITAATAGDDPCVTTRVDSFFTTLEQTLGLGRGRVEYVALPAEFAEITSDSERVAALRSTSAPDGQPALHMVWTDAVQIFGQTVWGVSAGAPGAALSPGHDLAGVVVDISLGFPAVADGMTMVHEAGHFMGLFHTSSPGNYFDPLTDTPECPEGTSPCPDARNIMQAAFYGTSGGIGLMASEQQQRVVWGSPIYRATP